MAEEQKKKKQSRISGAIVNKQDYDDQYKSNIDIAEESRMWYETIAQEYAEGKITDEAIRHACENTEADSQGNKINPETIIEFCKMSNLERQKDPRYKSDLSEVETKGTDYHGTLASEQSVEIAGCKITAKTFHGDDVAKTTDPESDTYAFGVEKKRLDAMKESYRSRSTFVDVIDGIANTLTGGKVSKIMGATNNIVAGAISSDVIPEERTLYYCESEYLGNFWYDPEFYQIGYKEVQEFDGTTSQLPVLLYKGGSLTTDIIADTNDYMEEIKKNEYSYFVYEGQRIANNLIPKNCKNVDYTFVANSHINKSNGWILEYAPILPESVTSANYTFKGCNELQVCPRLAEAIKEESSKTYYLPASLECAQGMFKGCSTLHGYFESNITDEQIEEIKALSTPENEEQNLIDSRRALPHDIVNTVDMFSGCDGLDKTYFDVYNRVGLFAYGSYDGILGGKVEYGIEDKNAGSQYSQATKDEATDNKYDKVKFGATLTPYLTPNLMRGIYDDIKDSTAMISGADIFEDGGYLKNDKRETIFDKYGNVKEGVDISGLDQTKLDGARAAMMILNEGKFDSSYVDTSVEVATDGQRANNIVRRSDGTTFYDKTGEKKSYQEYMKDSSAWWEKAIQVATVGLTAMGIVKGASGNKWAGLAAGAAGGFVASKFLPSSLYPVVHGVAEFLHSDKLEEWAQKLPGAKSAIRNEEIRQVNKSLGEYNAQWDNDYNTGRAHFAKRIGNQFEAAVNQDSISMLTSENKLTACVNSMRENAKAASKELNFAAVASLGEDNAKCVTETMMTPLKMANNRWKENYGTNPALSSDQKQEMKDFYQYLMEGLQAYSVGATDGIYEYDAVDENLMALQTDGLEMVDRAYTEAVIGNLKEMDAKYHFMDDVAWEKLSTMTIAGVDMSNIRNYDKTYFNKAKEKAAGQTVVDIKALAETDDGFKKSMGEELTNIDARIPDGWAEKYTSVIETPATSDTKNKTSDKSGTKNKSDKSVGTDKSSKTDDKTTKSDEKSDKGENPYSVLGIDKSTIDSILAKEENPVIIDVSKTKTSADRGKEADEKLSTNVVSSEDKETQVSK